MYSYYVYCTKAGTVEAETAGGEAVVAAASERHPKLNPTAIARERAISSFLDRKMFREKMAVVKTGPRIPSLASAEHSNRNSTELPGDVCVLWLWMRVD